jgi:DnaJ-domain-containing protein 1
MSTPSLSRFEQLCVSQPQPLGIALLLVLAWTAHSDGEASSEELAEINRMAEACSHGGRVSDILSVITELRVTDLQLACEIIREACNSSNSKLIVQMVLFVALADGYLRVGEAHIVRLLADLVGVDQAELDGIFREVTGHPLPVAGDPGSRHYWHKRGVDSPPPGRAGSVVERIKAYALLGLDDGASADQIKSAFRRLAQVHHPDRYRELGPEAVAAATESFRRMKAAYDYLLAHA